MSDSPKPPAHTDPSLPPSKPTNSSNDTDAKAIQPDQTKGLSRLPGDVKVAVSKSDELLLRLNKLIKTTAGLSSGLSTLQYSLYFFGYLHAQSPSRAKVIAYLSQLIGRPTRKLPPGALTPIPSISPLTSIGAVIADTRTTLRLTGLLPLYVWLKTLLSKDGSKSVDPITYRVALVQCVAYMSYQAIENTYHLTNKSLISPNVVGKRGGVPKWVAYSCRAWLVGVASDLVRLARESQLARERRERGGEKLSVEEQDEADRKWWAELRTCVAWLPVAVHYSTVGGATWANQGIIGFCGLVAGLNNTRNAWVATK